MLFYDHVDAPKRQAIPLTWCSVIVLLPACDARLHAQTRPRGEFKLTVSDLSHRAFQPARLSLPRRRNNAMRNRQILFSKPQTRWPSPKKTCPLRSAAMQRNSEKIAPCSEEFTRGCAALAHLGHGPVDTPSNFGTRVQIQPSCPSRLARERVHRQQLEHQPHAQADAHVLMTQMNRERLKH